MSDRFPDIYPRTPTASLERNFDEKSLTLEFDETLVGALTGMNPTFLRRALGRNRAILVTLAEVLLLLDMDAFTETFVPRSRIPAYLLTISNQTQRDKLHTENRHEFFQGDARELMISLPKESIQCVVTSTPYWATRLYDEQHEVTWADGETCQFGHEQTPEGFIRHTVELLYLLKPAMTDTGSIWWNLMDTYNTRTQIRSNAAETLNAMKGNDTRGWKDFECRRYSAGHSFLKDGEQCLIPLRVAERASHIGYWVKSIITWKKDGGTLPEPVNTRVTREIEYIIHLATQRSPYFDKQVFRALPPALGGRNPRYESDKIADIWSFPTASGTDGHGAQFPIALPARCIALSTKENDVVLDPFAGSGTTAVAATRLNRRSIGFDISRRYLDIAKSRLAKESKKTLVGTSELELQSNGHVLSPPLLPGLTSADA